MNACRACKQLVFWALSVNGRRMPVNEEPDPRGNLVIAEYENGTPVMGRAGSGDVERYTSHFATCPAAADFRKKRATS